MQLDNKVNSFANRSMQIYVYIIYVSILKRHQKEIEKSIAQGNDSKEYMNI